LFIFQNFSQVEIIEYTINSCNSPAKYFIWPLKLKYLKINFRINRDYNFILRSLDCLSSLISLELYQKQRDYFIPNGQLWENLIRSSLPLLKIFKFYFQFERHPFTAIHFQQLIASFSTPFYVNERKWFIQGNRYDTNRGIIFSIPFFIKRFTTSRNSISESISTFPKNFNNDFHMNKYANVETLEIDHTDAEPDENFNQSKIINLIINVDFDFVNWLSILTKLRHLEITPNVKISSNNFRRLLKTTSHLCSLSIEKTLLRTLTEDWSNVFICNYLSEKISILNLYYINYQSCSVSQNELRQIVRIFGSKCQHLSLSVRSPNDTITLILQNMSQLHSLHVHITATEYESSNMIWLEKQKTKFNNSNCRIINIMNDYYFWL